MLRLKDLDFHPNKKGQTMKTKDTKDIHPTSTLRKALDALWGEKAISAAILFHQLAEEMALLYIENNGEQFAPDVVSAIEDSIIHPRILQNVDSLDLI